MHDGDIITGKYVCSVNENCCFFINYLKNKAIYFNIIVFLINSAGPHTARGCIYGYDHDRLFEHLHKNNENADEVERTAVLRRLYF